MGLQNTSTTLNNEIYVLLWVGIGICLAMSRIACLAYSLNMILIKEHAPGPSSLGTANGLAQVAQCLARAVAPTFVSCLFALSVDNDLLGGHLWMIVMVILSIISWVLSANVPEGLGNVDGFKTLGGM